LREALDVASDPLTPAEFDLEARCDIHRTVMPNTLIAAPAVRTLPNAVTRDAPPQRIASLDVLRGVALFGMLLVHFAAIGSDRVDNDGLSRFVSLFLEDRFFTIFGILFGASFAIQLQRADAGGRPVTLTYLRRLTALAAFGLVAEIAFGYRVLLPYAIWGLPLLGVRRWPPRTLLFLAIVLVAVLPSFRVVRAAISVAENGELPTRTAMTAQIDADGRRFADILRRKRSPNYRTVIGARVDDLRWTYARPEFLLSFYSFPLFLLGLAAFRLHLFDRPASHRAAVVGAMIAGALSWAAAQWMLPSLAPTGPLETAPSVTRWIAASQASTGFGVVDRSWLAFTYAGAVLLALGSNVAWTRWLLPFAWVGRAALSNYFVHIVLLDLFFTPHGLAILPPRLALPMLAVGLFGADALLSQWWLTRYKYGPLEWLWRSATYWSWQPQTHVARVDP
jgi:uncharacterized protein